jgi:molybdopterin-guanine dinucleotide biosynthesis protein A
MIAKREITGIILAGGKSSRMGRDKGLCTFNGKALVEYAMETLRSLCGELMISANHYPEKYSAYGIPIVADEVKDIGPMGGIYSCLKRTKTQHNLILSCDTPFVGTLLMKHLLSKVEKEQVVVPAHHKFLVEPLAAYYATNVIGDIQEAMARQDYKLLNLFKRVRFKSVPLDKMLSFYDENSFLNINRPSDLEQAEQIINSHDR